MGTRAVLGAGGEAGGPCRRTRVRRSGAVRWTLAAGATRQCAEHGARITDRLSACEQALVTVTSVTNKRRDESERDRMWHKRLLGGGLRSAWVSTTRQYG